MEMITKLEMIPIDRISISSFNVRSEEPFGDEEDQELIRNIESVGLLQPIIVRFVGDRYELLAGRRRFLSAKEGGLTEIPCIIKQVYDEEALDISLSENIFRKPLDPATIGRALKRRIKSTGISQIAYANKLGISKAAMSRFLRITDLSPELLNEIQSGTVTLRDAIKVARMELPPEKQVELAREAREGGFDSFKVTFDRIVAEHEKRGAPKGLLIVRINFGKKSPDYNRLKKLAKSENIELGEYCQKILIEHIQSRKG